MREIQDIKRLLYPLVKGLPVILLVMTISIVLVWRMTVYQNPIYESMSILRLDDHGKGFSDNNLYKDFDVFSETNDVLTEVEIIKSEVIVKQALRMMPTNVSYYRVGSMRTSEIYDFTPFTVTWDSVLYQHYDKRLSIKVVNEQEYLFTEGERELLKGRFGKKVMFEGSELVIHKNTMWVDKYGVASFVDQYEFEVNTIDGLYHDFVGENLLIKEIDKDIAIIKIHFEGEHPQRVAAFCNNVAESYIQDHIDTKTMAAKTTQNFLQEQLKEIGDKLSMSESLLEEYRLKHRVYNTRQETETGLRELSQLNIQLINIEMKRATLDSLWKYIDVNDDEFIELAPAFESYGGLLYTELIKKLKSLKSDRIDLLTRYTESSIEVTAMDEKIADVVSYLKKNIANHRENVITQLQEIHKGIDEANAFFDDMPSKERKMIDLEREFRQNQELYAFLKRKMMESDIAKAAEISFHRLIEKAVPAGQPSSPNRPFNVALAGFLSLLLSIALVYSVHAMKGTITSRYQIEQTTKSRVLGVVKKVEGGHDDCGIHAIIPPLIPMLNSKEKVSIAVTSSIQKEGKTFISKALAKAMALSGRNVLLVDLNYRKAEWQEKSVAPIQKTLSDYFNGKATVDEVIYQTEREGMSVCGFCAEEDEFDVFYKRNFAHALKKLMTTPEVVILDTGAFSIASEVQYCLDLSDYMLFVTRHNFTHMKYTRNIQELSDKYGSERIATLINAAPRAMNYSGKFFGSRYQYSQPKGILGMIKHYWESYMNAWSL